MKKIVLVFILFSKIGLGQGLPKEYMTYKSEADSLYKIKEYKKAAYTYNMAFATIGRKAMPNDRYKAACCWAQANYADSAFYHLYKLANQTKFTNYDYIVADNDLIVVHKDPRWPELLKIIKANKDKIEEKYNHKLILLIDSIHAEDQKWRILYRQFLNHEIDTTLYTTKTINANTIKTDSLNYFVCCKIIKQYGFPNYELVGPEGSRNFWVVLQHMDDHVLFQDSALKLMKIELDKNQANGVDYAYLTDRVKVNMKEHQIYGTQMELNKDKNTYQPLPVVEPEKLNERRRSVGLETEEDYIKTMNNRYYGTLKK